jgi:2-methylcitrate dehydratase PrpD
LSRRGIKADQVRDITISQPAVSFRQVGLPYDASRDSVVHAQFNVAYCFARALHGGAVDMRAFQRPKITDPFIAAITARTQVMQDDDLDPLAMGPVLVRLTLQSGETGARRDHGAAGRPGSAAVRGHAAR